MKMRVKEVCYEHAATGSGVAVLVDERGFQLVCSVADLQSLEAAGLLISSDSYQVERYFGLSHSQVA